MDVPVLAQAFGQGALPVPESHEVQRVTHREGKSPGYSGRIKEVFTADDAQGPDPGWLAFHNVELDSNGVPVPRDRRVDRRGPEAALPVV